MILSFRLRVLGCFALVCLPVNFAHAEEPAVVTAEVIEEALTRSIGIAPIGEPRPREEAPTQEAAAPAPPKAGTVKPASAPMPQNLPGQVVLDTVLFELNSAELRAVSQRQLDEVAKALGRPALREARILVRGHTCNLGGFDHNMRLSEARARAVKAYLMGKGVDGNRLQTEGKGPSFSIASNSDEAGRTRNRRVDFLNLEVVAPVMQMASSSTVPESSSRGLKAPAAPSAPALPASATLHLQGAAGHEVMLGEGHPVYREVSSFAIDVSTEAEAHLYIMARDAGGEQHWLTPLEAGQYGRGCYAGDTVRYPESGAYALKGMAPPVTLFVLLSDAQGLDMTAFRQFARELQAGAAPPGGAAFAAPGTALKLWVVTLEP